MNLAGRNMVSMSELRALAERLGMQDVRTILQSGNLVFRGGRSSAAEARRLERLLEAETKKALGVATDFFVRSAGEWEEVVAANPFKAEAKSAAERAATLDPAHEMARQLLKRLE